MANYLKQENQLIVWPVLKEVTENDLFQGNIGIRAHHHMTTKELLQACLEAWKVNNGRKLSFILGSCGWSSRSLFRWRPLKMQEFAMEII